MTVPNIIKGQIALDPTNDLLYYVNESNTIVSTSLSWVKNNTNISTAENVVISGDLTVSGSTVTVNVETLLIEDNIIVLNTGVTGSPSTNAGIEVERGTSTNVQIRWNESTDKWQYTNNGTTFYNIIGEGTDLTGNLIGNVTGNVTGNLTGNVTGNTTGNLTGNVTGNVTGDVTGNAGTATKLATARTIQLTGPVTGSAFFDGSSSVSISTSLTAESTAIGNLSDVTISSATNGDFLRYNGSSWINDAVDLGTDTTGNFVSNVTSGNGITVTHTAGEGSSAAVAINTAVVVTLNDSQILTNKTLATPNFTGVSPKVTLGGDLYGNVTLNNLQSGTLDAYLMPESVMLGVHTSGDYVSQLYSGTGVEVAFSNGDGPGAHVTLSIGQPVGLDATPNFARVIAPLTGDVIGNLNGNVTGNVTGNIAGNVTGNVSGNVSGNVTGNTTGNVIGDLTGNVTGNLTGNVTGYVTGNVTGNLSGNVTGNVANATNVNTTNLSVNSFIIDPTGAENGKVLKFSSSLGKFVPADDNIATSGSLSVNDLYDVDTTGKINGQYLRWNQVSSNWVPDNADTPSNIALGTNTIGNYVQSVQSGNGIILSNNSGGASATPTFSVDASIVATLNDVQTLTQKTLTSPTITGISPVITLAGDLTGSATLTNLGNTTITAAIAANSVALGTDTTGDYVSALVAGTGVTLANNSGENSTPTISIGQAVNTNSNVTFDTVTTTGSITVAGNINVTGSLVTTNQTSLSIEDPIIYLNSGATPTDPDLGFAGNYNDGIYRHAGLFSDASDGHKFKFFKGLTVEPTHPVDTSHESYVHGDVVASTFESKVTTGSAPLVIASTTLVPNLNAQYLNGQAGTYYAPTNSPTFTGTVTLPANTITNSIIASNTIDYSKLASGPATSNFNIIFNDQVAAYTLVAGDLAKMVTVNSSSATIVTVPNILSTGDQITVLSKGTGTIELRGDTGVTVNATPGRYLRAQWSSATLVKLGSNSWLAIGDLKA